MSYEFLNERAVFHKEKKDFLKGENNLSPRR